MIFMVLTFLIGSYVLGIAWVIVFWVASLAIYLAACILSLLGVYLDISGDRSVWALFLVVCAIAYCVFVASNFGFAVFIFLTGTFMLFRSADIWRISG